MSRLHRALVHVAILSTIAAAGCSQAKKSAAPSSPANESKAPLRVFCAEGHAARILKQWGPLFQAATGIPVDLLDPGSARADSLPAEADLWAIEPADLPFWAAPGKLTPVPADLTAPGGSYRWENILPLYRSKLLVWNQVVLGLPLLGDPLICFYRRDLLADPKLKEEFKGKFNHDLVPPASWQEVEHIAAFFNQKSRPGIDHPCTSLPALPKDDNGLNRTFYIVAAPLVRRALREDERDEPRSSREFSFDYDLNTGLPLLHEPGFIASLEMLKRLEIYRAKATDQPPELAFAQGEAILCFASPSWIPRFRANPRVRDKFGIVRLPGSSVVYGLEGAAPKTLDRVNYVPYLGSSGALLVVPRTARQPENAFRLAAYLSDPKTSSDIVIEPAWGGGIFRASHLDKDMGWQAFGLSAAETESLIDLLRQTYVHTQVRNPLVRLRIPDQATHRAALLREVRAALFAGKDPKQAMQDADAAWRALDANKSVAQRIADYRLSLSLSAGN